MKRSRHSYAGGRDSHKFARNNAVESAVQSIEKGGTGESIGRLGSSGSRPLDTGDTVFLGGGGGAGGFNWLFWSNIVAELVVAILAGYAAR